MIKYSGTAEANTSLVSQKVVLVFFTEICNGSIGQFLNAPFSYISVRARFIIRRYRTKAISEGLCARGRLPVVWEGWGRLLHSEFFYSLLRGRAETWDNTRHLRQSHNAIRHYIDRVTCHLKMTRCKRAFHKFLITRYLADEGVVCMDLLSARRWWCL